MNSQEMITLGDAAKSLIESDVYKLAMDNLRLEAHENWIKSKPEEQMMREDMYYLSVSLALVEAKLKIMIDNAKYERKKTETPTHLRVVPANESSE